MTAPAAFVAMTAALAYASFRLGPIFYVSYLITVILVLCALHRAFRKGNP
jgi:hypothetical protein